MASMLGLMSSSSPELDDMLHLLFRRVARPVVPAALRGGLRNQEIQVLRSAPAALAENWSSPGRLQRPSHRLFESLESP
jgi:hypothetical protein